MTLTEKLLSFDPYGKLSPSPAYFHELPRTLPAEREIAGIRTFADRHLGTPLPLLPASLAANYTRTGNRSDYESPYFLRRRLAFVYACALHVTGDDKYFDPMLDAVWAMLEETSWIIPAHQIGVTMLPPYNGSETDNLDLFSACTGGVLAFVYHWHRERLDAFSPVIAPRIERMLQERILRPILNVNHLFWMQGTNNWTPWVVSNVLTVLIGLNLPSDTRELVVARVLPMLAKFAAAYHDDGGCDEGPSYWNVASASLFDCMELLGDLTDGSFTLYDDPKLKAMGEYIAKAYIANSYYLNFADAPGRVEPDGVMISRFGQKVGSSVTEDFGRSLVGRRDEDGNSCINALLSGSYSFAYRAYKNLLTMPEPLNAPPLFQRVWLDGLQVFALRQHPQADKGLFFACKGGSNGENHNHNDVGSFVVYQDGQPLLPDLGVGTYTRFTFDPVERWRIFSMQSAYHNLMEIGGHLQLAGRQYCAKPLSCTETAVSFELAQACPAEARVSSWVREMGMTNGIISVTDRFLLDEKQTVRWYFITFEKPVVENGAFLFAKARLDFDPNLTAWVEEQVFTDQRFVRTWEKDRFYRLVLELPVQSDRGAYTVTVRAR